MDLIVDWCNAHALEGMQLEVVELPGRTPLLCSSKCPGEIDDTVLLYGHMDKQPEMTGWDEGLGPWKPVLRGDRLYGRGGADDGYSTFASLAALKILEDQGVAACTLRRLDRRLRGERQLGSTRIHRSPARAHRQPSLVVCLDSGAGNYDQLWCTTSLRGMVLGNLHVEVIREGVHSGEASGIVPSSFRIVRMLLCRLEDEQTGRILPDWLHCEIPPARAEQAGAMADALGEAIYDHFPWHAGAVPVVAGSRRARR